MDFTRQELEQVIFSPTGPSFLKANYVITSFYSITSLTAHAASNGHYSDFFQHKKDFPKHILGNSKLFSMERTSIWVANKS